MAKVYTSCMIATPASAVWQVVRNFNGLPDWTPFVAASHIEGGLPPDQVGCIRNFTLKDGGLIREQLLAFSDIDMLCTYSILESPMGVANYIATLALHVVTDGNATFATWRAEFDAAPEREPELVQHIGQTVFQGAFNALKARFAV